MNPSIVDKGEMDHLITAPVVFRSLAICGIDGVKVPNTKTIHKMRKF